MTVLDFATRKQIGDQHENRVRVELESRGWTVTPYGQALFPEPTSRALRNTDSRLRWDPDMVASHGPTVCLIDGKSNIHGPDAQTFKISRLALRAHIRLWAELDLPIYYVFANLGVATPVEVMQICCLSTIGKAGSWLSIGAGMVRPFDDVFGPIHPPTWGADPLFKVA